MKADKPFEEVQVSDAAVWRWVREGDIYVNRMTQEHMNQFKTDIEQAILHERASCAQLLDDFAKTKMVPARDTWRMGVMAAANAVRDKK